MRAGCSSASCFECCLKSGKACEAHAKQIERKQREDELLAAVAPRGSGGSGGYGAEGGSDEDARLPKGAFHEVAFHGEWNVTPFASPLNNTLMCSRTGVIF